MAVSVVDYNGNTWTSWTTNTNTATSASNVTSIWPLWCNTTATASTTNVWLQWAEPITNYGYRQPTPEEVETRKAEAAERQRIAAAGKAKARQLLKEVLDRAQRRELEKDGHFHVTTRDGERVYRIKPGSPPLRVKGEDGIRWSYCIHPRESFPADDTAAALKLLIDADEDEFLRIANATWQGRIAVAA